MKLNNNHKILLGLAIGGGIAWWLTRKKSATTSSTSINTAKAEDLTREEKIDYILDNIEANIVETQQGFSGERFEYDPKLGYSLPYGIVRVVSAGNEVVLPREGNLAQEVFFNADGETTDNPVEEAEAVLDALTDKELNVAFKVSKARVQNPNVSDEELFKIANISSDAQTTYKGIVREKFNDLKALSKHPNWKKGLLQRIETKGMTAQERKEYRKNKKEERKQNRGAGTKDRPFRDKFKDEVTNRQGGAMWGGYRNDGQPTNADAVDTMEYRGGSGRRPPQPNERRR